MVTFKFKTYINNNDAQYYKHNITEVIMDSMSIDTISTVEMFLNFLGNI
jgi:hypothetical protein